MISLARELMALLEEGGFRLTKWTSNSREVLASIPEDKRARPTVNLDLDELPIERALGVLWNVEKDVYQFEVFKPDKPATKRGILSAISSLYDPMGYVCPVVLEAKKIMQRLWKLQLAWDDPVRNDVNKKDSPNTTPTVRAICTFAVYFSVFRPFCRFTLVYEGHFVLCYKEKTRAVRSC